MLIVIVRRINCNEEQQAMKFSTGIDISNDIPKTEFSHVSIDIPVQANFLQNSCSWYMMESFSVWCNTLWTPGNLNRRIPGLSTK